MKVYQLILVQVTTAIFCAACGHAPTPPPSGAPTAGTPVAGAPAPDAPAGSVPARIVADFSGGKVTLMGSLPTQAVHDRVLDKAKQLYGAAHVVDQLGVDVRVAGAPWLSTDAVLLPLVDNTISDGQSAFDGDKLTLTGEIPSEIMKAQIAERAAKNAGSGIKIDNHLQVTH